MATAKPQIRIGVDVGGTNTDAVAVDITAQGQEDRGVIAHHKAATTPDVTSGITAAVQDVLKASKAQLEDISAVVIGTTHFINAVVEQDARRLKRVAVIRLSKSFLREVPPFSEFPDGLTAIIRGHVGYVDGGLHIDGSEEASVKEDQVVRECKIIKELGLTAVVIAGVYSPIDEIFQQENKVRDIVSRELPDVNIVCSHEVANIGFIERENASILNASILHYGKTVVRSFKRAMRSLSLKCPLFLTQNDGTLLDSDAAAKMPIKTFSSGATNSMRGAAYLSNHKLGSTSAIVIDVGGTTADIGMLLPSGLPRQASAYVTVAGVRVNYSMPFLHSIGLGGGSIVRENDGKVLVGPDSVGHYLTRDALVFGGKTCTATDVAVAASDASFGQTGLVQHLSPEFIAAAKRQIQKSLEDALDVIKTSPEPLTVLSVGGGSILVPQTGLSGASKIIRPPYHDVANAVGAAISQVGGTVDIVQDTTDQTVPQALQHAKEMAIERAVAAGALKSSVQIAEVEAIPLTYVTNRVRTIVKAVGDLDTNFHASNEEAVDNSVQDGDEDEHVEKDRAPKVQAAPRVDPRMYKPDVTTASDGIPSWNICETDLSYLADGCYVLGCAGGGSPAASFIQLRNVLRQGHKMRVIDHTSLKPDANVYWGGHMGSPAVSVERLQSTETIQAFKALMEYFGHASFDAVMGLEIGGANGLEPFLVGSTRFFDRPIIDGDWMGRAYPTYWQTTLAVHCPRDLVPCSIDSGDGNTIIMTRAKDDEIVDRALRASCAEMGSRVGLAAKPTTPDKVSKHGVLNTVSLAWRIGRCIAIAEATNSISTVAESIIEEAGGPTSAKVLFRGKITEVERRLYKGHSWGTVHISSLSDSDLESSTNQTPALAQGGQLKIPFKNENIFAEHIPDTVSIPRGKATIIASVPDLIIILDASSGRALGVPEFKYGYKVVVLGITCSPRWTETQMGLDIGGPGAFGYDDVKYKPLGVYKEPRSVIEEYK
ncbi:hypothetical protein E6O75_ATG09596 [Venturia nashicola]|uniref:Hydantoinase/oxoprolinase n=1 Tax=Venturia nashicola TaxID=86259 RepID=A0A4Z1P862_9PEZI|nr:hypothetical protein E6O75_ATG09596 [Venturia nashicola]